jgi:hypothetical protein
VELPTEVEHEVEDGEEVGGRGAFVRAGVVHEVRKGEVEVSVCVCVCGGGRECVSDYVLEKYM